MCLFRACWYTQGPTDSPHCLLMETREDKTRKPWASSSFLSSAETGLQQWQSQMLHSLLSHPFAEPMHYAGMKKPLAVKFQKSSGTEGKAKEPVLIQRTVSPLKLICTWENFNPGENKNSREFFPQWGKENLLYSLLCLYQASLPHISLCTSASHLPSLSFLPTELTVYERM